VTHTGLCHQSFSYLAVLHNSSVRKLPSSHHSSNPNSLCCIERMSETQGTESKREEWKRSTRHHGERVQCRYTFHDLTNLAFQPLHTCSDPFVWQLRKCWNGVLGSLHSALEGSAIVYAVLWWWCVCLQSNAVLF
jgi:hypothetical protein